MSQITVENIKRSSETVARSTRGVAAAWVNFNGTGTIAARDSENVSSLTDNGTGDYTVSFTNAFGAADYTHSGMGGSTSNDLINVSQNITTFPPAAGSARYEAVFANGSNFDSPFVGVTAHGDLA
jgi:hypothetical protein